MVNGFFGYGCKKDDPAKVPVLSTTTVTNITSSTATSGGTISSDGGASVTARGVCWNIPGNPTTSDSKSSDGEGTGQFESSISDLDPGTTYHIRAYASNSIGTSYGEDLTFTTLGQSPAAITQAAANISTTGATLNGIVNANDVSTTVTFEYGTTTGYGQTASATPGEVSGNTSTAVSGIISGLTSGVTYHFRIKAVNSLGTSYGSDMTFTTTSSSLVSDIDGNVYNTVTIGTQVWLKENLKATKYTDGTSIPNITDNTSWSTLATAAYSDYSNLPASSATYGRLYNYFVVASTNTKKVCPTGWHVPTDAEWATLISFLGGDVVAGGKLKETGTSHWITPNTGATNETGFTALPGGYRSETGTYGLIGNSGYWWSSTEGGTTFSWDRYMYYNSGNAVRGDMDKNGGFSVRCLKN